MSATNVSDASPAMPLDLDIEVARKKIEDEIEDHANAITMLKHRLNAMTKISRLPSELLSEIFVCCAQDYFKSYTDHKTHSSYYSHHRGVPEWVWVAHICHAWREIALSTPRLWSFVPVTQRSIAEQLLLRSKKAPLSIAATHLGYNTDRKKVLETVFSEEMHRMRELFISGPSAHVYELCAKLTEPANMLCTLALSDGGDNYTQSSSDLIPQNLFNSQLPRLRCLEIRRLVMRWDNPLLCSALTNLVIIQNSYRDAMGTFEQFISALESMPGLRSIELANAIPPTPAASGHPPSPRTIVLPHLRDISLGGSTIDCANFLRHLSPGADIQLHLVCREEKGLQSLILSIKAALARSKPWCTIELAQRFSDTDVTFRAWPTNATFTDSFRIVEPASFTLELSARSVVSSNAHRSLFEQFSMFSSAETFVVDACTDWKWKNTFTAMKNLREIVVLRHAPESMLAALSSSMLHGKKKSKRPLTFSRLKAIKFYDVRLATPNYEEDEEYFDQLIDCMIYRCNYYRPVQEVHIMECRNIIDEDVVRLREIVPEVVWDGVVDIEDEEEEEDEEEYSDEEDYDPFEEDMYYDPFFDDPYDMW